MNGINELFLVYLPFNPDSQYEIVEENLQSVLTINSAVESFLAEEIEEDDLLDIVQASNADVDNYIEIVNLNLDSLLR